MDKIESTDNIQTIKKLEIVASSLPGAIYWKNKNSVYLGMNEFTLQICGLKVFSNFIGKTDRDLWPRFAEELISHDQEVICTGKTIHKEEAITLPNGKVRYFIAIKAPLKDNNNNIIGIIGNSIDITAQKEAFKISSQLCQSTNMPHSTIRMSNRELACIKLLKEGLNSKQIAAVLNISKRTVEQYIDTAKNKFGCKNSVELVYKCFKNGIVE